MKNILLFLVPLNLICTTLFAQCPVTTSSNNLTALIGNASDLTTGDVIVKSNAITISGVNYDAVFTILSENVPTGAFIIDATASNNFNLSAVQPDENPYVTYNLKFVQAGSATLLVPGGIPISIIDFTVALPDIDGAVASLPTGLTNRNYTDVAGHETAGSPFASITLGSAISANGFFGGGPAGFTTYRTPSVPSLSVPVGDVNYWITYDYPGFPQTGVNFVFGTSRDAALNTGTPSVIANRLFFHNFIINCSTALPVKLISFNAFQEDCKTTLKWKVADESNFDYYEVQYSFNGIDFFVLDKIPLEINSNGDYQYVSDNNNGDVKLYYRLKMTDLDGSYSYSKIITGNINCKSGNYTVFPTITKSKITITKLQGGEKIELCNMTGNRIAACVANNNPYELHFGEIPKGMYLLKIEGRNGMLSVHKIIKE
jgi:hypothetical protein